MQKIKDLNQKMRKILAFLEIMADRHTDELTKRPTNRQARGKGYFQ